METLKTLTAVKSNEQPALTEQQLLTDEDIYGPGPLPEIVLAQREAQQELQEENVSKHAENIVYSTEVIGLADQLLGEDAAFVHNEGSGHGSGIDAFRFGSFDIERSTSEDVQQYRIRMIQMGSNGPERVEDSITIRGGKIDLSSRHEGNPGATQRASSSTTMEWSSDKIMDPYDLTRGSEGEVKAELAKTLSFIELHSEKEREKAHERQERMKLPMGRRVLKSLWG